MFLQEQNSKQSWLLNPDRTYRLGRNPDRDICFDESSISRNHAELFWNGETWCVRDCGSTYGTFVDDRQLQPSTEYPLHANNTLQLGTQPGIKLRLRSEETSPESPQSPAQAEVYFPPEPPAPPFKLDDFRGNPEAKQRLKQYADLILNADLKHPVQGILLLAAEGRGKRFLCRCLADQLGQERETVFNYTSQDLQDAQNLAQAGKMIRQWLKECVKHAPIVFLLQNFDTFYQYLNQAEQARQYSTGHLTWWNRFTSTLGFTDLRTEAEKARHLGKQLTDDIKTYWQWNLNHKAKIVIVASVSNPDLLPADIREPGRVFSHVLPIPRPDEAGRVAILEKYLHKTGTPLSPELDLHQLAQQLGRADGEEIQRLIQDVERRRFELGSPQFTWRDFEPFLSASSDQLWEQLVLPETVLQRLQQLAKILREADLTTNQGPALPKGLLLTGPPGTGKTEIARVLAQAAGNCHLEVVMPSTIKSPLVGQAVQNLKAIFTKARSQAPSILFFDEIDALFPRRDDQSSDPTTLEIVNEFLQATDGFNASTGVFILGATNRSEQVDTAVASRLRNTLYIPLPDAEGRCTLLERTLQRNGWHCDSTVNLMELARLLQGKSGRDIQTVVDRASEAYFQRVDWTTDPDAQVILNPSDFEAAILPAAAVDATAWNDLVLSPEIKANLQATLRRFLDHFRNPQPGVLPPKGMLLHGPPGTGKTQVARVLARAAGCRFINLSIAEIRSKFVGEATKRLSQTFDLARREAPVILFIDEIDALFPRRDEVVVQHEMELVNQVLQELDGVDGGAPGVFVVGATNFIERVDEAVKSRLNKTIAIPLPRYPEIIQLLRLFTQEMTVAETMDWEAIARLLQGKSGRDIRQLVSEVGQYAADRLAPDQALVLITDHFRAVLQAKSPTGDLTWDDLILPEETKQEIRRLVRLVANYATLPPGVNLPKGILLSGPPGTGKTQTARVIASVAGLYFRSYGPGEIRAKYVGQSAKNLQNAFAQARQNSPAILFFDEIESLFPSRGEMGTTSADREDQNLVSQFLQEVDGVKIQAGCVFVFGATNYPDKVDEAVRSRLHKEIAIPLPTPEARLKLLQSKIHSEWQLAEDVVLKSYADRLAGQSGRDIVAGIDTAAQLAFDQWVEGPLVVSDRHFRQAFQHLFVDGDMNGDWDSGAISEIEANQLLFQGLELLKRHVEDNLSSHLREAKRCLSQALSFYEQSHYQTREALTRLGLAWVYTEDPSKISVVREFVEQGLKIYQTLNDRSGEAIAQLSLGITMIVLQQFQASQKRFELSLQLYRELDDSYGEAGALWLLGSSYAVQKQFDQVISILLQARTLYQSLKEGFGEAYVLLTLGTAYLEMQEPEQGLKYLQQSQELFQSLNSSTGKALALYHISIAYRHLGKRLEAAKYTEQVLTILKAEGSDFDLNDAMLALRSKLTTIGLAQLLIKQYEKTFGSQASSTSLISYTFTQSFSQPQELSNQQFAKSNLNVFNHIEFLRSQIENYISIEEYQKAIELCKELSAKCQQEDNQIEYANVLSKYALIYFYLGEFEEAITNGQHAQKLYQKLNQPYLQAMALFVIAIAQFLCGQDRFANVDTKLNDAINSSKAALNLFNKFGQMREQLMAMRILAGSYAWSGKLEEAYKCLQSMLKLAEKSGNSQEKDIVLCDLALFACLYDLHFTEVTEVMEQKLFTLEAGKTSDQFAFAFMRGAVGIIYFELSIDVVAAEKNLLQALEVWKESRQSINDLNKISVFEIQANELYNFLQQALIAQQKTDTALEVAEQGRAHALRELLCKRYQLFSKQVSSLKVAQIQAFAREQRRTFVQYSIIYGLKDIYRTQHRTQRRDRAILIWVIQPNGEITFRRVDFKESLDYSVISQTQLLRTLLSFSGVPEVTDESTNSYLTKILKTFYEILIEPIEDLLPNSPDEHVVFIPQGPLFLVPFAAITDREGRALIDRFSLSIAPSIQTLQLISQRPQPTQKPGQQQALVVGNPTLPTEENFDPLPWAEGEASTIATLLNTTPLLRNNATKATVVDQFPDADIIHLSAHGDLDDRRGLDSAIVLTPSKDDDGYLKAREILDMTLKARLVVLSACDTGRGRLTGDGVVGLSRSFIAAGVSSLVVSLWPVSDLSTAFLMEKFYQALQQGESLAVALRQAQIQLREITNREFQRWLVERENNFKPIFGVEEWKQKVRSFGRNPDTKLCEAPYHWAGFILIGDTRWEPSPPEINSPSSSAFSTFKSPQVSLNSPQSQQAAQQLGQGIQQYGEAITAKCKELIEQALLLCENALNLYQELGETVGEAIANLAVGYGYWFIQQSQAGKAHFEKALTLYGEMDDRSGQALAHLCLGQMQIQQQFEIALQHLQHAKELYHLDGNLVGQATVCKILGSACLVSNKLQEAEQYLQDSVGYYDQLNDQTSKNNMLFLLGGTYLFSRNFDQARKTYTQARQGFQDLNQPSAEAVTLYQIGSTYDLQGNPQQSSQYYQQAQNILTQHDLKLDDTVAPMMNTLLSGNTTLDNLLIQQYQLNIQSLHISPVQLKISEVQAEQVLKMTAQKLQLSVNSAQGELLQNLAKSQGSLGKYQSTLNLLEQALAEYRADKDTAGEADILFNLCNAYRYVGQNEQAIDCGNQAKDLYQKLDKPFEEAWIWQSIGMAQININMDPWATSEVEIEEAKLSFNNALDLFKALDKTFELTILQSTLGLIDAWFKREYDKGSQTIQEALQICHELDDRSSRLGQSICLNHLGAIQFLQHRYQQAIIYQRQSLEIAEALADLTGIPMALGALGLSLLKIGNLSEAEQSLRRAIESWETLRQPLEDLNKVSIFELQTNDLHTMLQQVLVAQNRPLEALEIAEQGRARAFAERLAKQFIDTESIEPLKLTEVQQVASQQQATLIQYSIAYDIVLDKGVQRPPTHLYIWIIQPNQQIFFEQIPLQDASLLTLIDQIRPKKQSESQTLEEESAQLTLHARQELSHLLIAPIAPYLPTNPGDPVIFIPHGILFLVPFAALQTSEGRCLIEQFRISIVPSIQTLQLIADRPQTTSQPLIQQKSLIIGNPTLLDKSESLLWGEGEAQTVASLLNTQPIIGSAAIKASVTEQFPDANLIHLSAHGILDEQQGLESAIALAPSENDDGYLKAHEVLNLSLKARLVVLSACDTGRGRITGDGVIGLSRSFISAGVTSLVVSLWPVNELSTAFLMERFYQALQQGISVSEALRQAQIQLREITNRGFQKWVKTRESIFRPVVRTENWLPFLRSFRDNPDYQPCTDPYYWAGFIIIGDK